MDYPNLRIVQDCVSALDVDRQMLSLRSGEDLAYDRLCIATGARPKKLADSRHVLTLRDNSTVEVRHCSVRAQHGASAGLTA